MAQLLAQGKRGHQNIAQTTSGDFAAAANPAQRAASAPRRPSSCPEPRPSRTARAASRRSARAPGGARTAAREQAGTRQKRYPRNLHAARGGGGRDRFRAPRRWRAPRRRWEARRAGPVLGDDTIQIEYRPGTGTALLTVVAGPEEGRLRLLNGVGRSCAARSANVC